MFPIYICYDSTIKEAEKKAIRQGLMEIRSIFVGSDIFLYGTSEWSEGSYRSADQLIASAKRNKFGRINGEALMDKLNDLNDSWTVPGAIILITSEDLYSDYHNLEWCMGLAKGYASVQSVRRFRGLSDEEESICIRRTLRHELGHIFGCPSPGRTNTDKSYGYHCTNYCCSMQQIRDVRQLLGKAIHEDPTNCFCPQCMRDLQIARMRYDADEQKRLSFQQSRGALPRTPAPIRRMVQRADIAG